MDARNALGLTADMQSSERTHEPPVELVPSTMENSTVAAVPRVLTPEVLSTNTAPLAISKCPAANWPPPSANELRLIEMAIDSAVTNLLEEINIKVVLENDDEGTQDGVLPGGRVQA